jgi:hypothetical protein
MWLLEHPARVFQSVLLPIEQGAFVLNVLVSADKWDSCAKAEVEAVVELGNLGLRVRRVEIPDSGSQGLKQKVVHISWKVNV